MNAAPDLLCHKVTADINHPGPPRAGFPLRFPFKKFWLIFNWPSCAGIDHALHRKTGIRRLWLPGVARQTCRRARKAVLFSRSPNSWRETVSSWWKLNRPPLLLRVDVDLCLSQTAIFCCTCGAKIYSGPIWDQSCWRFRVVFFFIV